MRRLTLASRLAILASLMWAAPSWPAAAQSLDELLNRYYVARGGLDRLRGLTTMTMAGSVAAGDQRMAVTMWMKRPNLIRREQTVKGQAIVSVFDGQRGWIINPFTGSTAPQEIPASEAQQIREQADFEGPLVDYQAKGHKVELAGEDTIEGRRAHRLRVTTKTGARFEISLDAETALEVKVTREVRQPTGAQRADSLKVETLASDYRSVAGIMMPFRTRTFVNGQLQGEMKLEKIEIDAPVEDALFKVPGR